MAQTADGIPYPTLDDPADIPADLQALADWLQSKGVTPQGLADPETEAGAALTDSIEQRAKRGVRIAPGLNGVVGDGVADDTAAIQALLNTVTDYGAIDFAEGTYLVTGLTLNQFGLTLSGASRGKTVIRQKAGATGVVLALNTSAATFKNPYALRDFDIYGATGGSHGISVRYASVLSMTNVRAHDCGGDGLRMYEVTAYRLSNCEVRDNAGNGMSLAKKCDGGVIDGCSIFSNDGWGIVAGHASSGEAGGEGRLNGLSILGTTFIQNAGGLYVTTASTNGVVISGGYFENNGATQHIKLGETSGGTVNPVLIQQCYFNHVSTTAVAVDAFTVGGVTVDGCFSENVPSGGGMLRTNAAGIVWRSVGSGASGGSFLVSDNGTLYTNANAGSKNLYSGIKLGNAAVTSAADFTIDRNGTESNQALRIVQSGAGSTGGNLLAVVADGTTTTQQAAFFRSKGTGGIVSFNDSAGTVLDILTGGSLRLGASGSPVIAKPGTGSPEASVSASIGSLRMRTDGSDSTALYVKGIGAGNIGWRQNLLGLTASATLDVPSIAAASSQELTVTVAGAAVGDNVSLGAPAAIEAGLVWNGYVSATDTVKIRVSNITAAAIDPASATWKVAVVKP